MKLYHDGKKIYHIRISRTATIPLEVLESKQGKVAKEVDIKSALFCGLFLPVNFTTSSHTYQHGLL